MPNAVYWTLVRCARNRRQGPNASPALLAARPTGSTELVSDDLPIFHWRHDVPGSANAVQQSLTVIEIRPFKGGWQCYEGPGVQPYWTGDTAKEDAIGYATARAKFGRGEIRVLDNAGEVERVIPVDQTEK